MFLSQAEANALVEIPKQLSKLGEIYPLYPAVHYTIDVESKDETERFLLDVERGRIKLARIKYNARGQRTVPLVRVDLDGPPHTNPDGSEVGPNHLHRYREGYDDRWAVDLDPAVFDDATDPEEVLAYFADLINLDLTGFQPVLIDA